MRFSNAQISLKEIPDEISLSLSISGCKVFCKDCHSKETWDSNFGEELTIDSLQNLLNKNKHISCVLFYGGEWDEHFPKFLEYIKEQQLKTALYSGLDFTINNLVKYLDYYKIGPYIEKYGSIDKPTTNQILYKKIDNSLINITHKLQG